MSIELIRMEGINKSFSGVKVLDNCRFDLKSGEVHALVGENGAGKSTLIKILTGVYTKDSGSITLKGKEVEILNPRAAQNHGISVIHQELNLMLHLTAAQNIFFGREVFQKNKIFLDDNTINQKTKELFEILNMAIEPTIKVGELTVAKQQMVEIAKALSFDSEILIMDEPTASLTDNEIDDLFRVIRKLKNKGVGIIYISHRLEELKKIADRITVMRDGCYINTVRTEDVTIDSIISMMIGREIYITSPKIVKTSDAPVVLEVRNLNRGKMVKNVSFVLKKGEILGFAGLMGAGRTEVARAIFGADAPESGEILVNGKSVKIKSPNDAVKKGIGYLSEDRKRYGLALGMDVETNIAMASFKKFTNVLGFVNIRKLRNNAEKYIKNLKIRASGVNQKVKNLSGGNQQKVVIAKWLTRNSNILIFDEPTRGIDVGTKSEIYKLLNELAAQGKAIIVISSELPEILRISDRVMVMCEGRITGELEGKDITQEKIMKYAIMREK